MKKAVPQSVLALLFSFISHAILAQSLIEIPFNEKIQQSSLIIEGKVVSKKSFWNNSHKMIFTSNRVEVFKIFKGSLDSDTIEILTQGGQVDNSLISTSDLLSLKTGETGTFFCFPNSQNIRSPFTGGTLYDIYGSSQGFFKYDPVTLSANAPFVRLIDVERNLYSPLVEKTGSTYRNIKSFDLSGLHSSFQLLRTEAMSITSFSPATVDAGATLDPANNVITINGSGFGAGTGLATVYFDDADDGSGGSYVGVPYDDPLMISWTATSIQLRVPANAGTGNIIVENSAGSMVTAPSTLNVHYAILDASFSFAGTDITKESNLMNTDGLGGYTIHYSTSTAGGGVDLNAATSAKQAFQRALTTWKELAGFNVTEGSTTTNQVIGDDGINTIMFDNTNTGQPQLAAGVLGVCYYFASMCTPLATREPQRTGFDIVIRNAGVSSGSANFTNGPCPPAASSFTNLDLETVLLHELGHAMGLGHVNDSYQGTVLPTINPGKLMNYALVNGVRRNSPDESAYSGALYLTTPQANAYGSCGLYATEMTPLSRITESKDECPVFPTTSLPNGSVVSFDLVHTTSNKSTDPQYTRLNCSGTGTGITNTAFYALKTQMAGALILSVSNYAANPASLASCTPSAGYSSAAGIELAFYSVSSCPAGQAFPTPVACRTFNGNGVMGSIAGLLANTTYLMVLDGIENTKATFDLTFGGTVLPVVFQSFTGSIEENFNQLKWRVENYNQVQSISIERSADGKNFNTVSEIIHPYDTGVTDYFDQLPLAGNNYYRLVITTADGNKTYSDIILLTRKENILVSAFPNPVSSQLNLSIRTGKAANYRLELYNNVGQVLMQQSTMVGSEGQLINIPVQRYCSGHYYLRILDDQNKLVKNVPIEKQ